MVKQVPKTLIGGNGQSQDNQSKSIGHQETYPQNTNNLPIQGGTQIVGVSRPFEIRLLNQGVQQATQSQSFNGKPKYYDLI